MATSSPLMWVEALDLMMARLAESGLDLSRLAAISGSAQQHGSVYLNTTWARVLDGLNPDHPIADQVRGVFSREQSPIWMDSSTAEECAEIAAAVGGEGMLAQRTGHARSSDSPARRSDGSSSNRQSATGRRPECTW